jgi:hypothetical protein
LIKYKKVREYVIQTGSSKAAQAKEHGRAESSWRNQGLGTGRSKAGGLVQHVCIPPLLTHLCGADSGRAKAHLFVGGSQKNYSKKE